VHVLSNDTIQQFRQLTDQDTSLRSLTYELKQPLIRIARQAELGDATELGSIKSAAEQALRLIDSYLLSAQTEYGQIALNLSPESTGSVLYDVQQQLRSQTAAQNILFTIDNRAHEPIMTHRSALTSILNVFGSTLIGLHPQAEKTTELTLRSFKTNRGAVAIGIFSKADISPADLRQALALQGKAHMPLSRLHSGVHISLAIADSLCSAIGGALLVKRMGSLSGFATELPLSEQLSLV
jgi:hypothetical protein